MGEGLGVLIIVAIVALTVVYLWIYHKFFHVVYFDLGRGCLGEFITAGILASVTVMFVLGGAIKAVGIVGGILGFILKLVFSLLKITIVIAIVATIGYVIYTIIINRKKTNSNRNDNANKTESNSRESNQAGSEENVESNKDTINYEKVICPICGHESDAEDIFCEECGNPLK